jgi:hypothetical protein
METRPNLLKALELHWNLLKAKDKALELHRNLLKAKEKALQLHRNLLKAKEKASVAQSSPAAQAGPALLVAPIHQKAPVDQALALLAAASDQEVRQVDHQVVRGHLGRRSGLKMRMEITTRMRMPTKMMNGRRRNQTRAKAKARHGVVLASQARPGGCLLE